MGVKLGNGKWAIKEDKLLAYNDNSGRFFNKEFDFSRGSSATYVAKDGLIKTAGLQATNLVNNGDFSELGSEIININNWIVGDYWNNSEGVLSINGENNATAYQENIFTVGKTYKATFNVNVTSGNLSLRFRLRNTSAGGSQQVLEEVSQSGTYTYFFEAEFPDINLVALSDNTAVFTVDNVSVKQVDPNDYWTITNNTGTDTIIKDGYAEIKTDGAYTQIEQTNVTISGKTYKLQYTVLESDEGDLGLVVTGNTTVSIPNTVGTHNFYFVAHSTSFVLKRRGGALDISITNISVQEIQTDTPRIDFSDSVKGALLLEPSSTQLIQYSEQFSQWSKINNPTVVVSSELAPNGTIDAYDITDDTVSYKSIRSNNVSINGTYNGSIFIRKTLGVLSHYPGLEICSVGSYLIINTTNGSVNQTSNDYSSIKCEDFGNWWRVSATVTASGSSGILTIWPAISINGTSISPFAQGTNTFWGAMVEQKSFSTSYIPNHGVSGGVTRLADVCNNSGSAQDFNDSEGVIYAEISALANDGTYREISLNDGTINNAVEIRYTNNNNHIQFVVRDNGSPTVSPSINISNVLEFNKVAFSYKNDDCKMYINGVKERTDINCTMANGLNRLSFNWGGANPFYGKVRNLQVFTEALTDEQLEKLTTI